MKATQSAEFVPDVVPVLSSGKHRNPRKGACFMEMASYLAGEKWSEDHPACTHPLLASLARLINDSLTDQDRPRIVGLVPDVVGITGTALEMEHGDRHAGRLSRLAGGAGGASERPCRGAADLAPAG